MRRTRTLLLLLLAVGAVLAGVLQVPAEWSRRAGLDFWNAGNEESLRALKAQERHLEALSAETRRRSAVCEQIAERVCDSQLTLSQGVAEVLAVGAESPEWFALLRQSQFNTGRVRGCASDREVARSYLLVRIDSLRRYAETHGDPTRAAQIAARLASFNEHMDTDGDGYTVVSVRCCP